MIRASMPPTIGLESGVRRRGSCGKFCSVTPKSFTVVSQHGRPDNGSDASPFSNVELFAPLKPFDEWPVGLTKDKLIEAIATGVHRRGAGRRLQLFSVHSGQY